MKEQMRQIGEYRGEGDWIMHPKQLRFVTWTLKYSRCHWLQVLGLEEHYARAELEADIADDGSIDVKEPKNVTHLRRFARRFVPKEGAALRVGETEVGPLPCGEEAPRNGCSSGGAAGSGTISASRIRA